MDIKCVRCRTTIAADHINLETSLAKCAGCNAVFDIRAQVKTGIREERGELEPPKGVEIRPSLNGLEIVRKWRSVVGFVLLGFCVFWDGFVVVFVTDLIRQGQLEGVFFVSIHGMVGLGLTYFALCKIFNRTHIEISPAELAVSHRPLPWKGNKRVPIGEISQLYTKERIHRNKNGVNYSYELRYLTRGGEDLKLVSGMEKPDHSFYLEQEIEKTLGIADRSVRGEYRGS